MFGIILKRKRITGVFFKSYLTYLKKFIDMTYIFNFVVLTSSTSDVTSFYIIIKYTLFLSTLDLGIFQRGAKKLIAVDDSRFYNKCTCLSRE